jgi:hypothetical protein
VLFGKAFDKTLSEALGFASCSIVTTTWCFQASRLFDARKQVQNGAVGDAEQSGRADEGGEAGDGKPAVAAEMELPQPLPLNSQPPGSIRSPISMISCVSARTCLASSAAISTRRLVHSRRTVAAPGIDRAVIILGVSSAERSASD